MASNMAKTYDIPLSMQDMEDVATAFMLFATTSAELAKEGGLSREDMFAGLVLMERHKGILNKFGATGVFGANAVRSTKPN